jgi:hypothetical protein
MDHNETNLKGCIERVQALEREVCILKDYLAARTEDLERARQQVAGLRASVARMVMDREYVV